MNITATAVDYQTIMLDWSYMRSDFYNVTNTYRVNIEAAQQAVKAVDRPSTERQYEVTGLTEKTTYAVSVTALTKYGNKVSMATIVTTPGQYQ